MKKLLIVLILFSASLLASEQESSVCTELDTAISALERVPHAEERIDDFEGLKNWHGCPKNISLEPEDLPRRDNSSHYSSKEQLCSELDTAISALERVPHAEERIDDFEGLKNWHECSN